MILSIFASIRDALAKVRTPPQNYDKVREEMGGAPWREVPKSTDAWYILDDEAAALGVPAERRWKVVAVTLTVAACIVFAVAAAVSLRRSEPLPPALVIAPAAPATAEPVAAQPIVTPLPTATPVVAPVPAPPVLKKQAPARTAHHTPVRLAKRKRVRL